MSFVTTQPEALTAAAGTLQGRRLGPLRPAAATRMDLRPRIGPSISEATSSFIVDGSLTWPQR